MLQKRKINRRGFLAAAAGCSVPLFLPGNILGYNRGVSPSNRINMMVIGIGNRGRELTGGFCGNQNYLIRGAKRKEGRYPDSCQECGRIL